MEPYVIERVPIDSVSSCDIAENYVAAGKAAIFVNVLSQQPWSNCAPMAEHSFFARDEEVSKLEAEINVQTSGNIQSSYDFEMEHVSGEAAMELLQLRSIEDPSTARTGTDKADEVLYVKLSLTGCERLMEKLNLQSFANPDAGSGPYRPSEHPLLLGPGNYFCWAYIGEAGTGSKTHVDVASSDAFLTVLKGKKEWAMVHPLDKHLVTNADGKMADLFNIDHAAFPEARRARVCTFIQSAGDCVFVPSEAPHCVRNLEASFSITYNFSSPSTSFRYHAAMDKVMAPSPTVATVDLVLFCPAIRERGTLRAYVKDMPSPLPTTEYACRMRLGQFHAAFGIYGRILDAEKTNSAKAVGYEVCVKSHRILYYYRVDSVEDFKAIFCRPPFVSEPYANEDTCDPPASQLFPQTSSHFGSLVSFPPLRVLINQPLLPNKLFPTATLEATLHEDVKAEDAKEGAHLCQPSPCSGVDGRPRQWHFSRFPFKTPPASKIANNSAPWCRTYLFYSSHDIHGPVSLHPLLEDATLQTSNMLACGGEDAANVVYSPHFEAFEWRREALDFIQNKKTEQGSSSAAPLLFALGADLIGTITRSLLLENSAGFAELLDSARQLGLNIAQSAGDGNAAYNQILAMGLEKIMILVLHFSCKPCVVGFSYSHTFSAVEEPNTICLLATAADALLKPIKYDDAAIALSAFCNAIDPPPAAASNGSVAVAVDCNAVPLSSEDIAQITESLKVSFPYHSDIEGTVRKIKDACKEKLVSSE